MQSGTGGSSGGPGEPASVVPGDTRIAFAPLSGPPQKVADELALVVASDATSRNIRLTPFKEGGASYTLKGYLSAVEDGDGTLLVYVWDVLSPDLQRVHRISGKVEIDRRAEDSWQVVDRAALAGLSAHTLDKLTAWLSSG
ncbi:hypothetical protein [Afifella pfennigii]|uniref:hypothetical protein n=1 Tax=Afifella pfennigii TaxID=209897 RepID=UPI00047EFD0A|nr:hypothetical protein [Afifella pfennigii]